MTDYTAILDTHIDPDAPITSGLAYQMRDNPIAIAEGALGAPKIAIKTVQADAGTTDISGVDAWSGFTINATTALGGAPSSVTISFSDDGVTYYGSTSILTAPSDESGMCYAVFDFATGSWSSVRMMSGGTATSVRGAVAGLTSAVTDIRVAYSAASSGGFIMELTGGESAT